MDGFYFCSSQASRKARANEYLTSARIMHIVLALENVMRLINIVCQYFLHFRSVLLNLCNNSDQT